MFHLAEWTVEEVEEMKERRRRRRRKRRWCQDLTQDTLPRLVRVTDKSETC